MTESLEGQEDVMILLLQGGIRQEWWLAIDSIADCGYTEMRYFGLEWN
jgi:hypothetical protein